jgi:hypothetical protein
VILYCEVPAVVPADIEDFRGLFVVFRVFNFRSIYFFCTAFMTLNRESFYCRFIDCGPSAMI